MTRIIQLHLVFLITLLQLSSPSLAVAQEKVVGSAAINPEVFGFSSESPDNAKALRNAIEQGRKTGLPVVIPGAPTPYKIIGDIVLSGDFLTLRGNGGNAHLQFENGGIIIGEKGNKWRGQSLQNLVVSRTGSAGPAITLRTTRKAKHSRFTWSNIHILSSSGDGLLVEGAFLGSVHGLWITQCAGAGIVFRPGKLEESNNAGANSIGFFGGEVQSCDWGIDATDTKSISFYSFAIEGNRKGGIWLRGDNRAFSFTGGYFENNSKEIKGRGQGLLDTDVKIGDPKFSGRPNRNISVSNSFFSDGKVQHRHAVSLGAGSQNIQLENNHFWAYGSSPVSVQGGKPGTSNIEINGSIAESPKKRVVELIQYQD